MTGPSPGYFVVMAQTEPGKMDEAVGRILKNMEKAKAGKIERDEYETALKTITALHAQENTTIEEQARQAAVDELFGLGYDYDKSFDARIEAVKLDDVVRAAKKYLGNYLLTTMSPEEKKRD